MRLIAQSYPPESEMSLQEVQESEPVSDTSHFSHSPIFVLGSNGVHSPRVVTVQKILESPNDGSPVAAAISPVEDKHKK